MDVDNGFREAASEPFTVCFPNAGLPVGQGATFLDDFNDDCFADERKTNLYYPFASRPEWETASFLLNSSLSMLEIDSYLQLEFTKRNNLSFNSAQRLHDLTDLLPAIPCWKSKTMKTLPLYPSRTPVVLYYRDAVEVLQDLMKSPLICDALNFSPLQIFEDSRKLVHVYDSWLSGTRAWEMQSQLPEGATLLGTILSSDKTTVSVITGNRVAHPLLISLANIDSDLLSKASLYLFNLLALLPVPKYIERKTAIRGVLENCLYHECLDIILQPLKIAAQIGSIMSDPLGQLRVYSIQARNILPQDLPAYQKASVTARTNGVVSPFWRDWPLAEPCEFLTPEPLHHWHKMFWDHDIKWAIQAVGATSIDFRFSIHQPTVGYRSFKEGSSTLKQVTGRTQRDVQRYLIPLISGAVTPQFVTALRALMDFRYAGQATRFNQASASRVQAALDEFHENKDIIQDLKARVNPKGVPIVHWEIPKLEFMQSVEPSIRASGPIMQWTADTTEHAHITLVKDPARSGNNHDFEIQICRHLDRQARVRRFDLMTAMVDTRVDFRLGRGDEGRGRGDSGKEALDEEEATTKISSSEQLAAHLNPVSKKLFGSFRPKRNFFLRARLLKQTPSAPLPLRIFSDEVSGEISAFSFVRDADLKTLTIEQVSNLYALPDFQGACIDFLECYEAKTQSFVIGGRRGNSQLTLPFTKVRNWSRFRIQSKTYFNTDLLTDPHTIFAAPPSADWEFGRQNAAIINIDPSFEWPRSSLEGHCVVLVKVLFTVSQPRKPSPPVRGTDQFLAYCERLDVVNQAFPPHKYCHLSGYNSWPPYNPDYATGCFILKRARRADGTPFGDVIPVSQFRSFADICPRYRGNPHPSLKQESSQYHSDEFFLNKYFNKELFFALDIDPSLTSSAK
ncbi:hypothetical protein C8R41DRAFT_773274 [Lentinula lateritia]|uniref:DUF6830 domain-containing protein n=1 Tax=Lentinula lateritia TaxID=40482 RepID=A0ABQ8V8S7_9AGAR|nr:hypothetical protein C8R41DRAFT_773274 [Lentinula lateritia]